MGQLLSFEDHALARLRARAEAAEEAREDLLAFARGQSGAVAAIHQAVLAGMEASSFEHLLHIVVQEWPLILGLDAVALGLIVGKRGFRVDSSGVQHTEAALLRQWLAAAEPVELRTVIRGHALFGPACDLIRAEALVRLPDALPETLLLLGQREEQPLDARHGSELLLFLGAALGAMLRRWTLID
ncbi:hypothetical protein GCM10022280_08130 [Sphingomonas swuensis]|uniref:DUF484 family protein n=1 Tax=Sphingomonas swuensis TaxID=977800 RepID=A0ABP7SJF9_9SPHN